MLYEKNATAKEGFPEMSAREFIDMLCGHYSGKSEMSVVTRIEFEYTD